ncbi:MAG: alpha/beta fold hydrolase [Pirellulales bacterium]
MPEYMIPTFFVPLAKLPLNSNGKVDYRALPKPTRDLVCASGSEESLTPGQQQLVAIWEEVFQVKGLSLADDFFALGGDSMVAIVLLAKVESHFGKSLALTDLMQSSSIGTFAELLGQNDEGSLRFDAVCIRTGNAQSPLFFVPCIHGNLFTIRELARALPPGKAIYGLQPIGIDGQGTPHETIDEIASHYLRQVQDVQPSGPYTLVGYSLGGTVSVRMAQMLQEQGHTVESLILIDPPRRWRPAWITAIQHMVHRTKDLLRWALWQVGFRNRPTPVPLPHQKMLEAHVRAITNFEASPYHGNVLLLEHTESEGVLKDGLDNFLALNDWSDILPAETRHAKIPGNHTTMFQGKNVQRIAAEVQSELGLGKVVVVSQTTSHQQMATA